MKTHDFFPIPSNKSYVISVCTGDFDPYISFHLKSPIDTLDDAKRIVASFSDAIDLIHEMTRPRKRKGMTAGQKILLKHCKKHIIDGEKEKAIHIIDSILKAQQILEEEANNERTGYGPEDSLGSIKTQTN